MDWYRFQKENKGEKIKGIKKRIRSLRQIETLLTTSLTPIKRYQ